MITMQDSNFFVCINQMFEQYALSLELEWLIGICQFNMLIQGHEDLETSYF